MPSFCSPMAANIQPQIRKKSKVPKRVAKTGLCAPSIKKLGLAFIKLRCPVATSISSTGLINKIIKFAIEATIVGGKLE
ncbi:MAG: hypothetical protein WKF71_13225 [Pyrinomonadaceae bacterium]